MKDNHEDIYLAQIIIDPSIIFKARVSDIHLATEVSKRIYRAVLSCVERNIKPDLMTILDADPKIDRTYLINLSSATYSAANYKYYEKSIMRAFQLRGLQNLGSTIKDMVARDSEPSEILETTEKMLVDMATRTNDTRIYKISELVKGWLDKLEIRFHAKGKLPGISSGIMDLDKITNGFQNGRLIVVAARPSQGKSALALNISCHVALSQKLETGFISLESGNDEILSRVFSAEGNIRGQAIQLGILSESNFSTLLDVSEKLVEAPFYLYDSPNIYLTEAKSIARQMVAIHGCKIIFIDYLQLIQSDNQSIPRHEQINNISIHLKGLSRELGIPIVALAQLKRDSEGREPEISDIRESSQIEQDADTVILIYHRKDGEEEKTSLLVKKNRDGPIGQVPVVFKRDYVKFYAITNSGIN
jgi:replicative DNA helicase